MEAIGELLTIFFTFLFEVTLHALFFLFLLVMAIFSPRFRKKLREQWETSNWQRFSMALGAAMYSAALVMALIFWTPIMARPRADADAPKNTITIKLSGDNVDKLKKTEEIVHRLDAAKDLIKRKLAERKQEQEADSTNPPPNSPSER